MLALTQDAAEAVEKIIAQPHCPDGSVVRISINESQANGSGPSQELQLMVVSEPEADDMIVEDLPISVDPETVEILDDKVLDADFDDGGVTFSLYHQHDEPGEPDGGGPASQDGSGPAKPPRDTAS